MTRLCSPPVTGPTVGCTSELEISVLPYDVNGAVGDQTRKKPESRCPRVMAKLGSIEIQCLIDTGSNATCIAESIFTMLRSKMQIATLFVANLSVSGALSGKSTRVTKQISVDILLGKTAIPTMFLVIPRLCCDAILGSDWLDLNQAIIDFEFKKFRVKNEEMVEPIVTFSTILPTSYAPINVLQLAPSIDARELSDVSRRRCVYRRRALA